jgi:hypothetical protein
MSLHRVVRPTYVASDLDLASGLAHGLPLDSLLTLLLTLLDCCLHACTYCDSYFLLCVHRTSLYWPATTTPSASSAGYCSCLVRRGTLASSVGSVGKAEAGIARCYTCAITRTCTFFGLIRLMSKSPRTSELVSGKRVCCSSFDT